MEERNEQSELNALLNEEAGRIQNDAADTSLIVLAMLGAYRGPVTLSYQMECAKALVRVLVCMAAVRACIEHGNGELTDEGRLVFIARLIAAAFDINSAPLVAELIQECKLV